MIQKLERYFNIMAELVRSLISADNLLETDISSVLEDTENHYHRQLREAVPELILDDKTERHILLSEISDIFFMRVTRLKRSSNIYQHFLLLYYMDRSIARCYNNLNNFNEDFWETYSLNTNLDKTGIIILKKAKCNWTGRSTGFNLNTILENFYYIDKDNLRDVILKNYVLDSNIILPPRKKHLRIGISPVTQHKTISVSESYEKLNLKTNVHQHYFRVEELLHEEELYKSIEENILKAGEDGADILVFPEMLGSRDMLERLISKMSENQEPRPALVVFPSIWEKTEEDIDNTNKSCLLLHGEEIIFEQPKRYPFHTEMNNNTVFEDINCQDNNLINLLHIEGLGRICIVICYDYLDDNNRDKILKNVSPTLICTPSFSTGSFNFMILSENSLSQFCNWVWCNTCSAAHFGDKENNFQTIGMITKLSKGCDLSDPSPFRERFPGRTSCEKSDCRHCIYYADIPLQYEGESAHNYDTD